jgi:flagellar basal body-associated protein FliL
VSDAPAPEAEAPPREKRRILLVLVGATLLAMIAGGWWAFGHAAAGEPPPDVDGDIVALEPLTTTVGERGMNHARVSLAVVLTEDADESVVEPRVALLQDALLRALAATDADTLRGAAGSDQLREHLSAEARDIWGEDTVRRVVLTELLVQ